MSLFTDLYSRGYKEEVRFEPSYSSSEEYSLPDLSPLSWSKLAKRYVWVISGWQTRTHLGGEGGEGRGKEERGGGREVRGREGS